MNIISGSTHINFAQNVAQKLQMSVTNTTLIRHPDSEIDFQIDESVREKHVFIIQTKNCCINDNIMELLIMTNACKLASSSRISAVWTYFPYSRQDKKKRSRTAIACKLLANMMEVSGINNVITMDLHSPQIAGFFNITVNNLLSAPLIIKYIKESIPNWKNAVIVSPDAGGTKRAIYIANKLGLKFSLIHKHKGPDNKIDSMALVGDVRGQMTIIIDDMADSGETLVRATQKLKELNASKVYAMVTHGVLSGMGCERINVSQLERLVVTNTLPQEVNKKRCIKLDVIDVSPIFAEAIRRIHNGESVSYLFSNLP